MCQQENSLPEEVSEFIDRVTQKSGGRRRIREDVRRELIAHFQDALESCSPDAQPRRASALIAEFGDPRLLASLIRRAKHRCRSPQERFAAASIKISAAALAFILTVALVQGWRAERDFQSRLGALEKNGLISDSSQLRSSRPPETRYFDGARGESAAAFLIELNQEKDEALLKIGPLFERLRENHNASPQTLREIRECLTPLKPLFTKVRAAAALSPTPIEDIVSLCHLGGFPNQVIGPELNSMDIAQAFLLNAWLFHCEDNTEEAIQSCNTALLLVEHLRDFPQLLPQLMAARMESDTFRMLGWMHGESGFPSEALALLLPHASRAEYERFAFSQAVIADSLGGRRVFHSGSAVFADEGWRRANFIDRVAHWFVANLYFTRLFRSLSAPDELGFFEHFFALGQCLKGPYYATKEQRQAIEPAGQLPYIHALTRWVSAALTTDVVIEQAQCETWALLFRTAALLEEHKKNHGEYPPSLEALGEEPQDDPRVDPFTGRFFVYKRTGNTYQLQSLGPNETAPAGDADKDDLIWGQ